LGVQPVSFPPDKPISPNLPDSNAKRRQRILCFNWNAGGLSSDAWDALQLWLAHQHFDIIALQETHWPFSSEWAQEHYWVMHSGTGTRGGGLLCMVSKRLCPAHLLTWQEPIPGRLLHLRIHGYHKHIDVVNVYQHVHATDRMESRCQLWHQLSILLDSLPKRNNVIVMGDLNTSLQKRTLSVGLDSYSWDNGKRRGPTHQDAHMLRNMLDIHSLVALNTWHHHLGPTYQFDHRHSRIDYIFCRLHYADATSRNVQYLHDFPLKGLTGATHVPLLTSLLKAWHVDRTSSQTGWTKTQRLELCQQWQHPNERIQHLQLQVQQTIHDLNMSSTPLDDIHAALNTFPPTFRVPHKESMFRQIATPFRQFQTHTKHLVALRTLTLGNIFKAWYHIQQRSSARRQMKTASKLARKAKLQKIYEAADAAERAGDPFRMYQAIRTLAPKQTFQRVTLRSAQGAILSPDQAADHLCDWFQQLYHDDEHPDEANSFAWPFSLHDFQTGLAKLPLAKALDPKYAPAPFWRWAAEPISQHLDQYFWECGQARTLPRAWSQGHLCFLPKSKSRTQRPQDLRPIALLEPCGKVLMGCLAQQLHEQLWPILRGLPQFAYVPGRGCDDALHRLALHCLEVRDCIDSFKFAVHQQSTGTLPGTLGGGLLLSLDLSKAFDAVRRSQLFAGLAGFGVSSDLLNFLKSIYSCTSFHFEYRSSHREFFTQRGIRQGCKAAPCLWTAQAALILLSIAEQTSTEWMTHCATLFADDGCFHQAVHSIAELRQLISFLGRTLDVLEAAAMTINLEKTTAMLRLVGPLSTCAQRLFVKRGKRGGAWLKIPRRNGTITHIRLVKHIQYLGATLSYYNFERQTMLARIKAGDKTSQQLTRWLHSQKGFNISQKMGLETVYICLH
jgi:exonuclease III